MIVQPSVEQVRHVRRTRGLKAAPLGPLGGLGGPIMPFTSGAASPTLSSSSADFGPDYGGKSITLTGTNLTGTTGVTIHAIACTSVVVVNSTTVTCVTPADTASTTARDIVITTPGGSATLSSAFTVYSPFVNISGGQVGYRYENATTTGGSPNKVSSWTDQFGTNHAIQATGANQPRYTTGVVAGHAALEFGNGGATVLATTSNVTMSGGVFTVMMSALSNTTAGIAYEQSTNVASLPGFWLYGSLTYAIFRTGSGGVQSAKDVSSNWEVTNAWKSLIHVCDGTNAGHLLYSSNSSIALTAGIANNPGTGSVADKIYIGSRAGLTLPLTGYICDYLVFNNVVSSTDRARSDEWLRGRVGL